MFLTKKGPSIISLVLCREFNCDNSFSVAIRNQLFKNRVGVELTMPSIRVRKFKERPKKNELPYFDAWLPATLNKRLVMGMDYYMTKRQIRFERKSTLAPCAPLAPMLTLPPPSGMLSSGKSMGGREADEESISPSVAAL